MKKYLQRNIKTISVKWDRLSPSKNHWSLKFLNTSSTKWKVTKQSHIPRANTLLSEGLSTRLITKVGWLTYIRNKTKQSHISRANTLLSEGHSTCLITATKVGWLTYIRNVPITKRPKVFYFFKKITSANSACVGIPFSCSMILRITSSSGFNKLRNRLKQPYEIEQSTTWAFNWPKRQGRVFSPERWCKEKWSSFVVIDMHIDKFWSNGRLIRLSGRLLHFCVYLFNHSLTFSLISDLQWNLWLLSHVCVCVCASLSLKYKLGRSELNTKYVDLFGFTDRGILSTPDNAYSRTP